MCRTVFSLRWCFHCGQRQRSAGCARARVGRPLHRLPRDDEAQDSQLRRQRRGHPDRADHHAESRAADEPRRPRGARRSQCRSTRRDHRRQAGAAHPLQSDMDQQSHANAGQRLAEHQHHGARDRPSSRRAPGPGIRQSSPPSSRPTASRATSSTASAPRSSKRSSRSPWCRRKRRANHHPGRAERVREIAQGWNDAATGRVPTSSSRSRRRKPAAPASPC